jgi:hypothetical protein
MKRRIIGAVAAALVGATVFAGISSPAYATGSTCTSGDICLYWGSNWNGGIHAFYVEENNYQGYTFYHCTASNCELNDNAASLISKTRFSETMLCDNSYLRGGCMYVGIGDSVDGSEMGSHANELSSHTFL